MGDPVVYRLKGTLEQGSARYILMLTNQQGTKAVAVDALVFNNSCFEATRGGVMVCAFDRNTTFSLHLLEDMRFLDQNEVFEEQIDYAQQEKLLKERAQKILAPSDNSGYR